MKEFFQEEFDWERNGEHGRVIDCAVVNLHAAYIAYETGSASGKKKVAAVVCALRFVPKDRYNFGYKDMDESMHPYFYDCPERILKLLTPTDNELANEWRQRCWENLQKRKSCPKLRKGMLIEFGRPLAFKSGFEEKIFRVVDPRRLLFESVSRARLCRLHRLTLQNEEWRVRAQKNH